MADFSFILLFALLVLQTLLASTIPLDTNETNKTLKARTFMHKSCASEDVHFDILLFDTSQQLGHLIETAKVRTGKSQWDQAFTAIYWRYFSRSNRPLDESKKIVHDRLSYIHHEVTARPGRIMFRCDDPRKICDAENEAPLPIFPVYLYPDLTNNWVNVCWQFYFLSLTADRGRANSPLSRVQALFRDISQFPAVFDREPHHGPLTNRHVNSKNAPNCIDDAGVYYQFIKAAYQHYNRDHPDSW